MKKVYLLYCYKKNNVPGEHKLTFANEIFLNKEVAKKYCECMNKISKNFDFIIIRHELITDKEYAEEKINELLELKEYNRE